MRDLNEAAERQQRVFDRAVAREREAIAAHERAATFHDATGEVLAQAALGELNPERSAGMARRAANERRLADTARERARTARARLAAEGVTVEE
ncbi:hypothetical protein [Geodermatophilus normandii]|uniref:hypothetical protein n=1 Tax=Geodermatophilus normandii TaxID=1137989 RepID=UPI0011B64C5A|nr:hypothetical protein [Geodermatophilus normandii]